MLPSSANKAEKYLKDRFGVYVSDLNLKKVNRDYWLTSSLQSDLEFETKGIRAIRVMDIGLKPTTYLLQLLDDNITRNIVELDRGELEILENGGMVEKEMDEKGYVALKFENRVIGCGLYKDELVSSRVPEGRMKELVDSI